MTLQLMIWNARGIGQRATQDVLKSQIHEHRVSIVVILEPMVTSNFDFHRRNLGFNRGVWNSANTIWVFVQFGFHLDVLFDFVQLLHIRLTAAVLPEPVFLSFVYAKFSRQERVQLWDELREIVVSVEGCPWMVGGDFNIFFHLDERTGSDVDRTSEMVDFAEAVADCELVDAGCVGSPFTWHRRELFELDRPLSDFRICEFVTIPFWIRLDWLGVKAVSDAVVRAKAAYLADPSSVLLLELNRSRAEYILRTRMEEDFWRQKSAVRWVVVGERNTRFFQSLVKQKRVRTRIHSIHADGRTISDENELRHSAASFFQHHLSNDMIFDADIYRDHFSVLPPSVLQPTAEIFNELEQIMARFFWGLRDGQRRLPSFASHQWQRLIEFGLVAQSHIFWFVGSGD
ncbi:hypothetical protein ACS0TY_033023 [Phlomoides rotata]